MAVPEVKQRHAWCPHARPGKGCTIYAGRPQRCQEFNCLWLMNGSLKDYWFPARAKIVIAVRSDPPSLAFIVDPAYPRRWREQPYLADIKTLARAGIDGTPHYRTVVMIADQTIPIVP